MIARAGLSQSAVGVREDLPTFADLAFRSALSFEVDDLSEVPRPARITG